jgi:hypothetical protein
MPQLVNEGLITPSDHPYVIARFGGQQVHRAELARFRRRLRDQALSSASIEDPVPLHRVARAIGGGPKPWGMIFRHLLEGKIPYSISGEATDRIAIAAENTAWICSMSLPRCSHEELQHLSQRDAAEILNLHMRRASILPSVRTPGGAHQIDGLKVLRLARTRVTLAELSARTGLNSVRLQARLEKDGCPRRDAFGWERPKALAVISKY